MATPLSRRDVLALLGAAGGAGLAFSWEARPDAVATFGLSAGQAARAVAFPQGAVIRTLLKDVPPESLSGGPVLFHEHLSMHYPPQVKEHFTDDVGMMVEEVRAAGKDGIACIVDGGHPDMDRAVSTALKRIAAESGVAIVASGGYYMQRNYPPEIATQTRPIKSPTIWSREAKAQRLGAFGEIGQQGGVLTDDERKVVHGGGEGPRASTGLPVFTHNAVHSARSAVHPVRVPHGRRAASSSIVLEAAGAKPSRLAIGHVCCLDDHDRRDRASSSPNVAPSSASIA